MGHGETGKQILDFTADTEYPPHLVGGQMVLRFMGFLGFVNHGVDIACAWKLLSIDCTGVSIGSSCHFYLSNYGHIWWITC